MAQAISGKPNTMLTLTVNINRLEHPAARAVAVAHAWRRLRRAICKRQKLKSLPFIAIFERTKRGEPHLHILLRAPFISQRWISSWMKKEEQSPICDIRRVGKAGQIVGYIAKYVTKKPERFEGTKRYWCSQDYQTTKKPDPQDKRNQAGDREVVHQSLYAFCMEMRCQGFIVVEGRDTALVYTVDQMEAGRWRTT